MDHFINNNYHAPDSGQYIEVVNPCTAEVVGTCARGNELDVNLALESAQKAFRLWKKQPTAQRVKVQHAVAQLMRKNAEELGSILANELGRPIAGCTHEVSRSADLLDFYAEEALRLKGEIPLHNLEGEKALV